MTGNSLALAYEAPSNACLTRIIANVMSAMKWLYMKSTPVSPAISGPLSESLICRRLTTPTSEKSATWLRGDCPDPPCSLLVLGGEPNGSQDVLDCDAEEVGPGCQHPAVASRSVMQEDPWAAWGVGLEAAGQE